MFQIRIHGRGGQGVVSGAEMLSVAAFLEEQWDLLDDFVQFGRRAVEGFRNAGGRLPVSH